MFMFEITAILKSHERDTSTFSTNLCYLHDSNLLIQY